MFYGIFILANSEIINCGEGSVVRKDWIKNCVILFLGAEQVTYEFLYLSQIKFCLFAYSLERATLAQN